MFERICVPAKQPEGHFDLGLLAECLIFYREVLLILNGCSINGIIQQLGPDLFLELILGEYLHVRYIDQFFIGFTKNKGTPLETYGIGFISSNKLNLETTAEHAFTAATGQSERGQRLANAFCQHVQLINYPGEIVQKFYQDIQDGVYLEEYIRRRLIGVSTSGVPKLQDLRYRFSHIPDQGLILHSNLNFFAGAEEGINTSEFEPNRILSHYGEVVADMSLWAQLNSESALTPRQADVLSVRVDTLLERSSASEMKISSFQNFVFNDSRSIREVINQGGREFRELLPVIRKARRFRDWLSVQQPDSDLIKAYFKEVTADTWIDRSPGKIARWSVFTIPGIIIDLMGAGGAGTAGGVALGALDSFFLDKIIKGWKPNQFIEGTLRGFLKK